MQELGETMATNLVSMGVSNASASDGLTTLCGKILNIAPSVGGITPTVSIDISKTPSTVYVGNNVLISAKVNADYDDTSQVDIDLKGVLQGATVTFKNNNTVLGTAITGSDGIATYTISNIASGSYSITAHFDGTGTDYESATSTALTFTPSVMIFYDDCTSDQTSQYDTLLQVASTSTSATLTYDSTEQAYTFLGNGGDKFVGRVIPNTRGQDNFKIRCKVKFKNTNAYNQFFIIVSDSLNPNQNGDWDMWRVWGSGTCNYVQKDSTKYDSSVNSSYVNSNYCYIELIKEGTSMTANLYDSSLNVLKTTSQTGLTYSNPYFAIGLNARYNTSLYGKFIKEIRVEPI